MWRMHYVHQLWPTTLFCCMESKSQRQKYAAMLSLERCGIRRLQRLAFLSLKKNQSHFASMRKRNPSHNFASLFVIKPSRIRPRLRRARAPSIDRSVEEPTLPPRGSGYAELWLQVSPLRRFCRLLSSRSNALRARDQVRMINTALSA